MLSKAQAIEAKELGYPQEIEPGDWIYPFDSDLPELIDYVEAGGEQGDELYVRIPSIEGMIEYIKQLKPDHTFELSCEKPDDIWVAMVHNMTDKSYCAHDDGTMELASFYLIKKIKGQ